jgi:hypothetical protein
MVGSVVRVSRGFEAANYTRPNKCSGQHKPEKGTLLERRRETMMGDCGTRRLYKF